MKKLGYSRVELVMPSSLKQKAIEFGKQDERPLTWVIIKALEAYLQNKGIHRIVDRFETLNMLDDATKTGRDQEWGQAPVSSVVGSDRGFMPKFALGDRVRKTKGSSWQGRVVGFYSTALTPVGYAVESEREPGSVQIYPEAAIELVGKEQP